MDCARRGQRRTHLCADGMMFLSRALGAALLAVPLAGAAGQSPQQHPPPDSAGSSGTGHRFAWIAGAGVASAAVFTTFVRLSASPAAASAQLAPVLPGVPVPNRYTDVTLPGGGTTDTQNPPSGGDSTSPGSGVVTGNQLPDLIDTPIPPGPIFDLPPNQPSNTDTNTPGDPNDGTKNPSNDQPPPPPGPPGAALAVVVTTPEPETFTLLGTGLVALVPLVRRRRRTG